MGHNLEKKGAIVCGTPQEAECGPGVTDGDILATLREEKDGSLPKNEASLEGSKQRNRDRAGCL